MGKKLPEDVSGWIGYYEAISERQWENYQETGDQKYETAHKKAEAAAKAFRAQAELQSEEDSEKIRRIRNIREFCKRIPRGKKFTRNEVIGYLKEIADF